VSAVPAAETKEVIPMLPLCEDSASICKLKKLTAKDSEFAPAASKLCPKQNNNSNYYFSSKKISRLMRSFLYFYNQSKFVFISIIFITHQLSSVLEHLLERIKFKSLPTS